MKKIGLVLATALFSLFLGAISAQVAFACADTIRVEHYAPSGSSNATVNCSNTGEDANYCYYERTCTGSAATTSLCDNMYAGAGLY